jgi:hypothetical protein
MYLKLDNVTALAQTVIKDTDDRDRNIWKQWCYEALLQLGIGDEEIRVAELYPQNGIAPLPDDCRYVLEFSLFDSAGNQLKHLFRTGKTRIYNDTRVPRVAFATEEQENCVPVDVSMDRTNVHLGTNGENVATIVMRYFAYPVDEDGIPMIREEDAMACVYFIRYMHGLRQDDNRSKIAQDQQAWFMEADRARARKKMSSMSPDKARSILTELTSMLPNFRSIQSF